ncbi:MAG: DNA/RNA nuclease SfsA [Desulfovibrionaceae bacterium]|nr:DNA/RNA nuclease SfsA [Desulfovibrionaceae bacterium]
MGETHVLLPYPPDCFVAEFIRREKRFSVEVSYQGQNLWIHTNNTGAMLGLTRPKQKVLVSKACNLKRKLKYTQEAVWLDGCVSSGFWVGVNTLVPNRLLAAAFAADLLPFAHNYRSIRREVKAKSSRLDVIFCDGKEPDMYVECKNVTLVEDECALFPDAKSSRACKHLEDLISIAKSGAKASMFFLVQRADGKALAPCAAIDPQYAALFYEALASGVQMYCYRAHISLAGIALGEALPQAPREAVL